MLHVVLGIAVWSDGGTEAGKASGLMDGQPCFVGGHWLKANSTTVAERPLKSHPVFIKTIINVLSGPK